MSLAAHGIDIAYWDNPLNDTRTVVVKIGTERFERTFDLRGILSVGPLRTAARFWSHGDRIAERGDTTGAQTMHALAIETLFPELSDRLPT